MLVKKKHAAFLQPFDHRCRLVEEYLKDFSEGLEIELFPLEDGYGPYNRSKPGFTVDFDTIVVSEETFPGGLKVNEKRAEEGLPPLKIVVISLLQSNGATEKISSTDSRTQLHDLLGVDRFKMLQGQWSQSISKHVGNASTAASYFWRLVNLYSEPWRRYHTLEHICELLEGVGRLEDLKPEEREYLAIAAFFHDAIYIPANSDNEAKSAELLRQFALETGFKDSTLIDRIDKLIIMTKSHLDSNPSDLLDATFLDLDLHILAAPSERYERYIVQVRKEYSCYTDEQFRSGRKKFLESLATKTLFKTDRFAPSESVAKSNIAKELQQLSTAAS